VKVVFVVGPTASGKSKLAMSWAKATGGAIFNCDSIQAYQGLNIGSAKPTSEELKQVPHFLFDQVPLGNISTAGQYQRDFFSQLKHLESQFPVVFVVGGTGFYFQAIEKGMYTVGAANEETIRQVEAELSQIDGPAKLFQELKDLDPETAEKISSNDHYRLARAIEMMRTHKRPVSAIKREFSEKASEFPYPLLKLGVRLSKEELLPRVAARTDAMLAQGLLKEVQNLLKQGLGLWAPLQSVGYRECLQFLSGEIISESDLREKIIQSTMKLAKKQRTWFRRDLAIHWFGPEEQQAGLVKIQQFLKSKEGV
jgi:tRNA dimethylallyltransferase